MKTTLERVQAILSEQLGLNEAEIKPESRLVDDLAADSLDLIEIVLVAEEVFLIEISDEDAEHVVTVSQAVALIDRLCSPAIAKGLSLDAPSDGTVACSPFFAAFYAGRNAVTQAEKISALRSAFIREPMTVTVITDEAELRALEYYIEHFVVFPTEPQPPGAPMQADTGLAGILPCPFCGKTEKDTISPDMGLTPAVGMHSYSCGFRIECEACGCDGPWGLDGKDAIAAWNRRSFDARNLKMENDDLRSGLKEMRDLLREMNFGSTFPRITRSLQNADALLASSAQRAPQMGECAPIPIRVAVGEECQNYSQCGGVCVTEEEIDFNLCEECLEDNDALLDEERCNALQEIAVAADIELASPSEIARIVCLKLRSAKD